MSSIRPLAPAPNTPPSLQDFREAAERATGAIAETSAAPRAVFGTGPGTGAGVTWLRQEGASTHMFIAALQQSFGAPVGAAIARELALDPESGRALNPHDVQRGIEMGQVAQEALAGVNFSICLRADARRPA